MSVDWFIYSKSLRKSAMIGSIGMGGVKVWPEDFGGTDMLRYIIENHVTDAKIVSEYRLDAEEERLRTDLGIQPDDIKEVIESWEPTTTSLAAQGAEVAKAYLEDLAGCDLNEDEPELIAAAIMKGEQK